MSIDSRLPLCPDSIAVPVRRLMPFCDIIFALHNDGQIWSEEAVHGWFATFPAPNRKQERDMINPEAGTYNVAGLTIYRDHARPELFYCVATTPRLSADSDGQRDFLLTLYRRFEPREAGGYLFLSVDLTLSRSTLRAALPELQKVAGTNTPVVLEPLPFWSGEIVLSAPLMAADGVNVTRLTAQLVPGQTRAVFTSHLSPPGATLLRQIIADGSAQFGVTTSLQFAGTRPDPVWQVQVNWTRVGQWLAERPDKTYSFGDIVWIVNELREARVIQLQSDSSWGEATPEGHERVLTFLAESLAVRYFDVSFSSSDVFTARRTATSDSVQEMDLNSSVVPRYVRGRASLSHLIGDAGRAIREVDLDDGSIQMQITCPQVGKEVEWLEVNLEYGRAGATQKRKVSLRSPDDRPTVKWLADSPFAYRYSYHGRLNPKVVQTDAYDFQSATMESNDAVLLIMVPIAQGQHGL
jgi:hypothetical protein